MAPRLANNVIRLADEVKLDWDQLARDTAAKAARDLKMSEFAEGLVWLGNKHPDELARYLRRQA